MTNYSINKEKFKELSIADLRALVVDLRERAENCRKIHSLNYDTFDTMATNLQSEVNERLEKLFDFKF